MAIVVTGANGMIGSQLVKGLLEAGYIVVGIDRSVNDNTVNGNYHHYKADLSDKDLIQKIVNKYKVDRFIHLAALAHTSGEADLSWERYYHVNVECAKNVFEVAGDIPVLFISTVDVYGFTKGKVNIGMELHPVSNYAKSKKMAEEECAKLKHFTIFRFSPVYTDNIKRDIQKRYYLKYPNIAYQIGKGTEYEILNVKKAVQLMVEWCGEEPKNDIRIIKDDKPMWTPDFIKAEQEAGRAKHILYFPKWLVRLGYSVLLTLFGENEKTYLLNKAIFPIKSE